MTNKQELEMLLKRTGCKNTFESIMLSIGISIDSGDQDSQRHKDLQRCFALKQEIADDEKRRKHGN